VLTAEAVVARTGTQDFIEACRQEGEDDKPMHLDSSCRPARAASDDVGEKFIDTKLDMVANEGSFP
jgi:hypothetical protein